MVSPVFEEATTPTSPRRHRDTRFDAFFCMQKTLRWKQRCLESICRHRGCLVPTSLRNGVWEARVLSVQHFEERFPNSHRPFGESTVCHLRTREGQVLVGRSFKDLTTDRGIVQAVIVRCHYRGWRSDTGPCQQRKHLYTA